MKKVAAHAAVAALTWVSDWIRHELSSTLDSGRMFKLLQRLLFLASNPKFYYTGGEAFGSEQQAALKLLAWEVCKLCRHVLLGTRSS